LIATNLDGFWKQQNNFRQFQQKLTHAQNRNRQGFERNGATMICKYFFVHIGETLYQQGFQKTKAQTQQG
jgi:hypothetical protein